MRLPLVSSTKILFIIIKDLACVTWYRLTWGGFINWDDNFNVLQGIYLLSAFLSPDTSPDQILVSGEESNYKCTIIGFLFHYILLAQFLWILLQVCDYWCVIGVVFLFIIYIF